MAKKSSKKIKKLDFADIVLGADAEVIQAAFEARTKIDKLLVEREEAYRKIAQLESQVEEVVGEDGVYPFPQPPVPIAGLSSAKTLTRSVSRSSGSGSSAAGKKDTGPGTGAPGAAAEKSEPGGKPITGESSAPAKQETPKFPSQPQADAEKDEDKQ